MKTLEERRAILESEIVKQQKKGWQISSRSETTCQLTKEKKPETIVVVILILLFVIPGLLYLIFTKGIMTVYIEVDEQGDIKYSGKDISPYDLEQLKKDYVETIVDGRQLSPYEIEMREKAKAEQEKTTFKPPIIRSGPNDLGLLTTIAIANGVGISEEEVIKLIKSNQLKGKKIGEKYFVLKEDFDSFMKS